jgi:hypothetical protein
MPAVRAKYTDLQIHPIQYHDATVRQFDSVPHLVEKIRRVPFPPTDLEGRLGLHSPAEWANVDS